MAKSMTERIKDWRKKKSEKGGRSLTVMLEPEIAHILAELKERYQESHGQLIARALRNLHQTFTCKLNESETVAAPLRNHQPHEESASSTGLTINQSLREIKYKLDRGAKIDALKEELKKAMKEMRGQGLDSSQIADQLYEARIRTTKGKEKWEGGTIRKWWK